MIRYIEQEIYELNYNSTDLKNTYVHNKETHETTRASELTFAEYRALQENPNQAYIYTREIVTEEQLEQERIEAEKRLEEWKNSRKKAE